MGSNFASSGESDWPFSSEGNREELLKVLNNILKARFCVIFCLLDAHALTAIAIFQCNNKTPALEEEEDFFLIELAPLWVSVFVTVLDYFHQQDIYIKSET